MEDEGKTSPIASGMNNTAFIALGALATVIASYIGLVIIPDNQVAYLEPVVDSKDVAHPRPYSDAEERGRSVYVDLGCIYCHSQQVRHDNFGKDVDRGWGTRASVPRDYIHDNPHLLGTMRTGPDLHNIGMRQPSRQWHMLHLYNPQITSPGSIMPPFRYLFRHAPPGINGCDGDIGVPEEFGPEDDTLCVEPTQRADDLVDYLLSLDHGYDVPELQPEET